MLGLPCGVLMGVKKLFLVGVVGREGIELAAPVDRSKRPAMKLAIVCGMVVW